MSEYTHFEIIQKEPRKPVGYRYQILKDGEDISNQVVGISINLRAGDVSHVKIEYRATFELVGDFHDYEIEEA